MRTLTRLRIADCGLDGWPESHFADALSSDRADAGNMTTHPAGLSDSVTTRWDAGSYAAGGKLMRSL
jgi:hypothetical protein